MYLFDPELHLRKYENEIEILKKFFEVRCNLYSDRRDLIISTLVSELELLEAKSTFIREYIEGILKINRQTKVIVEAQLKTRKYPMVEGSYDYLTRLPVISMTEEKINELQKSCEKKRSELARVKKMTAKTMWSADLEQISF
jgi:vacuolar-type H+-ATPase subunit I/STV1